MLDRDHPAVRAGVEAVQEEFDERGLGDATLLVAVILDAALEHLGDGARIDPDAVLDMALLRRDQPEVADVIDRLAEDNRSLLVEFRSCYGLLRQARGEDWLRGQPADFGLLLARHLHSAASSDQREADPSGRNEQEPPA